MDCTELIDLFNKVGGILICDYNKNIVKVACTNLKCEIKSTDLGKLEHLLYEFGHSPYEQENLKNKNISNDEIIKSSIKLKNTYLDNDEFGFMIKYLNLQ